jgi:hypothetical protein
MHPDCNVQPKEMSAAQKYNCTLSAWRYACAAGRQQGLGEVCACTRAQEIAAARSLAAPPNRCSRTETDLARELVLSAKVRRLDPGEEIRLDPTDQQVVLLPAPKEPPEQRSWDDRPRRPSLPRTPLPDAAISPLGATRSATGLALALIMGTALLVLAGMALWILAADALDALARRRAMRKEDGHAR